MKEGSVFKGLGPDHPALTGCWAYPAFTVKGEPDHGIRWQESITGKTDPLLAQVDGPGFFRSFCRNAILGADFGKTENMIAGDTDGTAAVAWLMVG